MNTRTRRLFVRLGFALVLAPVVSLVAGGGAACSGGASARRGGVEEAGAWEGGASGAAGEGAPASSAPAKAPGASEPGVLTREAVDRVRRDGASRFIACIEMTDARDGAKFVGWRVRPNACGTSYFGPGRLEVDDVVRRVNDLSLATPDEFMFAWEAVTTAPEIRVDLLRRGVSMTLVFRVK